MQDLVEREDDSHGLLFKDFRFGLCTNLHLRAETFQTSLRQRRSDFHAVFGGGPFIGRFVNYYTFVGLCYESDWELVK